MTLKWSVCVARSRAHVSDRLRPLASLHLKTNSLNQHNMVMIKHNALFPKVSDEWKFNSSKLLRPALIRCETTCWRSHVLSAMALLAYITVCMSSWTQNNLKYSSVAHMAYMILIHCTWYRIGKHDTKLVYGAMSRCIWLHATHTSGLRGCEKVCMTGNQLGLRDVKWSTMCSTGLWWWTTCIMCAPLCSDDLYWLGLVHTTLIQSFEINISTTTAWVHPLRRIFCKNNRTVLPATGRDARAVTSRWSSLILQSSTKQL